MLGNKKMDNRFFVKIKQMKLKDFIYPAIFVAGTVVFLVIFGLTIKFFLKSVDSVFISDEEAASPIRFDIDGFNKIVNRLGTK